MTDLTALEESIFKPSRMTKKYACRKLKLKSKMFTLNNKNIKQESVMELTFTLETRIQNQPFSQKYTNFSASEEPIFNSC